MHTNEKEGLETQSPKQVECWLHLLPPKYKRSCLARNTRKVDNWTSTVASLAAKVHHLNPTNPDFWLYAT